MRKLLCLLLILAMLPVSTAVADSPVCWRYKVTPGEALSGEGLQPVLDVLNTVHLELTSQKDGGTMLGSAVFLTKGKDILSVRVRDSAGDCAFACSLLGNNTLAFRRDQLGSVLLSLVQYLGNSGILKNENLEIVRSAANALAGLIDNVVLNMEESGSDTIIDLQPYVDSLREMATSSEETMLPSGSPERPDAVRKTTYFLSEADMNALLETLLTRVLAVPVIGSYLQNGSLRIGRQRISADFFRDLFASLHGETILTIWEGADGRAVRMDVRIPDISALVEDPDFSRVTGLLIDIDRSTLSADTTSSITRVRLTGLEQDLLTIAMEKGPGKAIRDPSDRQAVHNVGNMSDDEFSRLFSSMYWSIMSEVLKLVLSLPASVFNLLVDKMFKSIF
jgi:hypothetical protein